MSLNVVSWERARVGDVDGLVGAVAVRIFSGGWETWVGETRETRTARIATRGIWETIGIVPGITIVAVAVVFAAVASPFTVATFLAVAFAVASLLAVAFAVASLLAAAFAVASLLAVAFAVTIFLAARFAVAFAVAPAPIETVAVVTLALVALAFASMVLGIVHVRIFVRTVATISRSDQDVVDIHVLVVCLEFHAGTLIFAVMFAVFSFVEFDFDRRQS